VPPLDANSAVAASVGTGAEGTEPAHGLAFRGGQVLTLGPDLAGIGAAHHQHPVNLGQEADVNRDTSIDGGKEGGQRGSGLGTVGLSIPDAAGQVAIPVGVAGASLEVDRDHFDNRRVGVARERRVNHGPHVIKEAQTPATLQGAAQSVQVAILRDTIPARRDRDTSRFHPICDVLVPVAHSGTHSARFREAAAALNLKSVSVVLLSHSDLLHIGK